MADAFLFIHWKSTTYPPNLDGMPSYRTVQKRASSSEAEQEVLAHNLYVFTPFLQLVYSQIC